jgi:hypothetical protein
MAHLPSFCRLRPHSHSNARSLSCAESCAFEDPGCIDCPNRIDGPESPMGDDDPFKSSITNGWLHGELQAPS